MESRERDLKLQRRTRLVVGVGVAIVVEAAVHEADG